MDRIEAMAIFLKVVDTGSFSQASRQLRVPLATISRKVKELESHLRTALLVRTTRKLALTQAGAAYAVSARRILREIEETEQLAAGDGTVARGELVLTAPLAFGRLHVLPVVSEFLAAHSAVHVRLRLADRNLHLIDDQIDVAVRIGRLASSSAISTRVGTMRVVVCASPALLAERGVPRSLRALEQLPCVNFDAVSPGGRWAFRSPGASDEVELQVRARLDVNTAEAAVAAAVAGLGATRVLHYQCADALRSGQLHTLLDELEVAPMPVQLLHDARAVLPARTRLFLDFAVRRLKRRLAALAES